MRKVRRKWSQLKLKSSNIPSTPGRKLDGACVLPRLLIMVAVSSDRMWEANQD